MAWQWLPPLHAQPPPPPLPPHSHSTTAPRSLSPESQATHSMFSLWAPASVGGADQLSSPPAPSELPSQQPPPSPPSNLDLDLPLDPQSRRNRTNKQAGVFIFGAGFLALSVLVTRRAVARKIAASAREVRLQAEAKRAAFHADAPLDPVPPRILDGGVSSMQRVARLDQAARGDKAGALQATQRSRDGRKMGKAGRSSTVFTPKTPAVLAAMTEAKSRPDSVESIFSSPISLPPTPTVSSSLPPPPPPSPPVSTTPSTPIPPTLTPSSTTKISDDDLPLIADRDPGVAIEALLLATLNVIGFGIMLTGAIMWYFDLSDVEDLRRRAKRNVEATGRRIAADGSDAGDAEDDGGDEQLVEEWVAGLLERLEGGKKVDEEGIENEVKVEVDTKEEKR